jgi:hypothetical protein
MGSYIGALTCVLVVYAISGAGRLSFSADYNNRKQQNEQDNN